MSEADRLIKASVKPEKAVVFSMDEVRKSINIFAESVHGKTKDKSDADSSYTYGGEDAEEENYTTQDNNAANTENQRLINIYIALSKAKVQTYKDEPFIAQLSVPTSEDKQAIDSVRKELTQFIMQRTHYPHMKLEIITQDADSTKSIIYSPVDKFAFLMKQSPAIEKLKDNFKCEIKY